MIILNNLHLSLPESTQIRKFFVLDLPIPFWSLTFCELGFAKLSMNHQIKSNLERFVFGYKLKCENLGSLRLEVKFASQGHCLALTFAVFGETNFTNFSSWPKLHII